MAVWLDMIGSFVLGALLMVNVLRMQEAVTGRAHEGSLAYAAQSSATAVSQFMAEDFRKMGFGVTGPALLQADSTQVRFLADLGANGSVDTLLYSVGGPAGDTPNPKDRLLYRTVNSTAGPGMRMGITGLRLSYYNAAGDSLVFPVDPGLVRKVRVDLVVESPAAYDTTYARALMQFSVRPKNLKP